MTSTSSSEPRRLAPVADLSAAAAFERIARATVRDFRVSARRMRASGDDEALHEAHVALRRLRVLLALYDDAVTPRSRPAWARLRADVKALANAFGAARRLDVLLATYGDDPAIAARFSDARGAARTAANVAAANSGPLLRRMAAQAATAAAIEPALAAQPAAAFVAPRLARWHRWLRRHGHHLATLPPPERHHVRLRVKRLRYAIEFATPYFPGVRTDRRRARQVKALTGMQRRLGDLNDLAEAAVLLGRPELADAKRGAVLLAGAEAHFARFDRMKVFWE